MDFQPFNQAPPVLENAYESDASLRSYLRRALPEDVLAAIEPELREMGAIAQELGRMQLADRLNDPKLVQWDAWGNRVDRIELSPLWQKAEPIAAERGVVATAYEKKHGRFSRVHQFALAYLFGPTSDVYTCPLAMTDGAAHTLVKSGNRALLDRALPHLTSRDPSRFWTSGQWMTESTGGSDVGLTETVAKNEDGGWRLYGRKWFTSAATSQMTLTLARPEGNGPGGSGLALFYLETRDAEGRLRNIEVNRLKDKLGTRKVPTAELMLRGTPAELVYGTTDGIKNIAPMLNITRTWNAVMSAAGMARGLSLARDYAKKRVAFRAPLSEKPLHVDTLALVQAEADAALHLTFYVVELLGRDETGELGEKDARLLRLLTPIMKLTTAKQAVWGASELLEAFGGAGYVEDTGLPLLLRDAQVLPIWEGTTNVLSLDTLRALSRDPAALSLLLSEVAAVDETTADVDLRRAAGVARQALAHAGEWLERTVREDPAELEAGARRFALTVGRAFALGLLIRHANWAIGRKDDRPRAAAIRFATTPIDSIRAVDRGESRLLAGS
jgi:alkylation response protein AidB-like acyl-CoA dehydrogenase